MKKLLKHFVFIIFLISVLVVIFLVIPSFLNSNSLKFVQLTDIHYSLRESHPRWETLKKAKPLLRDAISQINNDKNVEFIMITGDGIDEPRKEFIYTFIDELKEFNHPWYLVLGDHEVVTEYDKRFGCTDREPLLTKNIILSILKEKKVSAYKKNSTYYYFVPKKGYKIIVLDAAVNIGSPYGFMQKEQLLWFDNVLKKSKNDIVLIFIHFPPVPPNERKGHEIKNANEINEIIKKYQMPIAIFSGHYHIDKIVKQDNVLHVSTPALMQHPHCFRTVEVINNPKEVIFKMNLLRKKQNEFQSGSNEKIYSTEKYEIDKEKYAEIKIPKEK